MIENSSKNTKDDTEVSLTAIMMKVYAGMLLVADILLLFVKFFYYIGESFYKMFVPVPEKSVVGEIVLVTGAGHGIGRELALKYASLGATVVCWDINEEGNKETADEIKNRGYTAAHCYKCDVSNRDEVRQVAKKVEAEVGNVTILINNAGIMPCHEFLDYSPEEIRKIYDINVLAHHWIVEAFLPNMIAKNHGHIVALSSMAGIIGLTNLVPYCASKFAVRGFMEAIREELRGNKNCDNIRITTIYPYMVNTGLCKKPKIRFENFMAMVAPEKAAAHIVSAQRKDVNEISIPSYWLAVNSSLRNFPYKSVLLVKDFIRSDLEADSQRKYEKC